MLGFEIADHISSSPISERVENQSQIARELYWEMILYLRLSGLLELLLVMERSLNLQMDSDPNQLQGKRLMHTHTHTHTHIHALASTPALIVLFLSWLHQVLVAVHELPLAVASRDYSFIVMQGLLVVVASLVEHRPQAHRLQELRCMASVVVAHGLSCSEAHGNFLDQESNLCPLHWQSNS